MVDHRSRPAAGDEPPDEADPPGGEEEPKEPERDLGLVIGMGFDPRGDEGRGSLWVVEVIDDMVYEIDLSGELLREIRHPYRDRE